MFIAQSQACEGGREIEREREVFNVILSQRRSVYKASWILMEKYACIRSLDDGYCRMLGIALSIICIRILYLH